MKNMKKKYKLYVAAGVSAILLSGCAPRALLDEHTGLSWETFSKFQRTTYNDAVKYCHDLRLGGHSDWRLPTIEEAWVHSRPSINCDAGTMLALHNWTTTSDEQGRMATYEGDCKSYNPQYYGDKYPFLGKQYFVKHSDNGSPVCVRQNKY